MRKASLFATLFVFGLLTGCSTGTGPMPAGTASVAAPGIRGMVHGGQQPVADATIQLWTVGTGGYGSTGSQLLTTTVTTSDGTGTSNSNANAGNANNTLPAGNFTITGDYTCPVSDPYVYITATGGNPGLTSGTNNTAISLMAALTDCNTLKNNAASTVINLNEVTTVASVYALQQFMNPSTGAIGAYSYSNTGLQNAFQTVNNLVNTSTGAAYSVTPNGNGVVPQQEIDTLADILAACVNTNSSSSPQCSTLFGYAQGSPSNTLLTALEIALNPGNNVALLYGIAGGTPPFQPTLSAAPNDWTVALAFDDGGGTQLAKLAIDSSGNVWATHYNAGAAASKLAKINALGVPQSGSPFSTNLNGAVGLAIDAANDVWIGNRDNGTLTGYLSNGTAYAGPVTGLGHPQGLAFDANGYLWVTDYGNNDVAVYNPAGNSFIANGYTSKITSPIGIAIDTSGNAWVTNSSSITELNVLGLASGASPISSGGIHTPEALAIDGSGDVWVSTLSGVVAELDSNGGALSGSSGYSAGYAFAIAIDGLGNVWEPDTYAGSLYELSSTGSKIAPGSGYQSSTLNSPNALAIDQSGNLWVGNGLTRTTGSITTSITEFVGVAAPVYTPLSTAVGYSQLAKRPGTPIAVQVESGVAPYYTPSVSYSAQLYAAGGNSGSFTWTESAGALPAGLSISSSGLVSGTTSATGSYTFTAQACDSQNASNCASRQFTLMQSSALTALGNESALTGSYAVEFEGYKNGSSAGLVYGADYLASITFNGSGTIAGEIDTNNATKSGTISSRTLTGYYTYGADNRGTLFIIPSGGTGKEIAFVGENFSGSTPQTLRLIEFDDTHASGDTSNAVGTGIARLQTSAAFTSATLNQSFAFGLQGETACNNDSGVNPSCATISPFGPLSAAGQFTGNNSNSITSGEEDAAGVNTTWNAIGLSGTYTNPDSSGRGTLSLTQSGSSYPAAGSNYVYYIVNSGEMFLMTADGHLSKSMLAGDALVQSAGLSNSTISGNYIGWEQRPSGGDGTSVFPGSLDSSLLYFAASGTQLTLTQDENNGNTGQFTVESNQGSATFSVASNGRMTLTGAGSGVPVFYVASGAQFFGTGQPSAIHQGGPGLITAVQQTPGTFTCGPTTGTYAIGEPPLPIVADALSGYFVSGTGAFTFDFNSHNNFLGQALGGTTTCASDSLTATTGRFTLYTTITAFNSSSGNAVYTIVPNSKYVMMSIGTTGRPQIITIEK